MYLLSKNLRSFMVAAVSGSFTEAANQLNITTSPLSKMISGLENYLETALFFRTSDGISLTAEGKILYVELLPHYEALMRIENEWRSHGRLLQKNTARELILGNCGGFISNTDKLLEEVLKSKIFSSVRVSIVNGRTHLDRKEQVVNQLKNEVCHAILSYEPFELPEEIEHLALDSVNLVAMVSTRLHEKFPTDKEKIINIPLTQHDFEQDNPLHQMIRKALLRFGPLKPPIILPEISQRLSAVKKELAFSLVPHGVIDNDNFDITITPFMEDNPIIVTRYIYFLKANESNVIDNILPLIRNGLK